MNGRYLLDTNIVFALFENDAAVVTKLAQAEEVFIASIVLGELYYGARRTGHVIENLARVYEFAQLSVVLACDAETSRWYSVIKELLLQKNILLPENDVWVAATALRYGLVLVTRDEQFTAITNLRTEIW
jgi:tRNA(fMet)-specific endonuclease VapC